LPCIVKQKNLKSIVLLLYISKSHLYRCKLGLR